jgi:hypothetical protein
MWKVTDLWEVLNRVVGLPHMTSYTAGKVQAKHQRTVRAVTANI